MKKQLLSAVTAAGFLFAGFGGSVSAAASSYTVQSGDTLWKISQATGVSVSNLRSWNKLTNDIIYANENLSLVAPAPQPAPTSNTYIVKSGDTLSAIARAKGTTVTALKSLNGLTTDIIYVGQKLLVSGTTTVAPQSISKAQAVITGAKKYIGVPYVWGGSTPAGFDCSGFTSYVYNQVGITIPRTTATQWAALKSVSTPNPGDLVFFETISTGPSHVGIYLGSNQFIHAGSHGITISDMTTSYWKPIYLGAKTAF